MRVTCSQPLRVLDGTKDWEWIAEMWCYGFWGFGVRPADTVYFAFSYGSFIGFWGAHYGCEKIGALVLPSGNMTHTVAWDELPAAVTSRIGP